MSRPDSPITIRDAVLSDLQARFGAEYKRIDRHGQALDAAELKRISTRAPALLLATRGLPRVTRNARAEIEADTAFVAFILTSHTHAADRADRAQALAFALTVYLPRQRWGLDGADSIDPATIKAINLTNQAIDQQGIAAWSVAWQQTNRIDTGA